MLIYILLFHLDFCSQFIKRSSSWAKVIFNPLSILRHEWIYHNKHKLLSVVLLMFLNSLAHPWPQPIVLSPPALYFKDQCCSLKEYFRFYLVIVIKLACVTHACLNCSSLLKNYFWTLQILIVLLSWCCCPCLYMNCLCFIFMHPCNSFVSLHH